MNDLQDWNRPDPGTARDTARQKAGEGAELVGSKAGEVAGTAREQAGQVKHEAVDRARDLAAELREQLQDQAREQTGRLASTVRRLADELREMSDSAGPDSSSAGVVRRVADGGHRAASRLEDAGPEGLVGDIRDFARRKPGVFLAGAALAGFAAARIGKGVGAAGSHGDDRRGAGRERDAADDGTGRSPYLESDAPGPDRTYGDPVPSVPDPGIPPYPGTPPPPGGSPGSAPDHDPAPGHYGPGTTGPVTPPPAAPPTAPGTGPYSDPYPGQGPGGGERL